MSYKDNLSMKVLTANNCELVALQYEAIIEEIENLKKSIESEDEKSGFFALDKIRDIISNLIASLYNGENDEFRQKTMAIYMYANEKLNEAYLNGDILPANEIEKIFTSQKDAWLEAGKKLRLEGENNKDVSNSVTYGKNDVNVFGSIKDFGRG